MKALIHRRTERIDKPLESMLLLGVGTTSSQALVGKSWPSQDQRHLLRLRLFRVSIRWIGGWATNNKNLHGWDPGTHLPNCRHLWFHRAAQLQRSTSAFRAKLEQTSRLEAKGLQNRTWPRRQCMYVCMYVCKCTVQIYVCAYACISHVCMHVCKWVNIHIYICLCA